MPIRLLNGARRASRLPFVNEAVFENLNIIRLNEPNAKQQLITSKQRRK